MLSFEELLAHDLRRERGLASKEIVCLLFTIAVVAAAVALHH